MWLKSKLDKNLPKWNQRKLIINWSNLRKSCSLASLTCTIFQVVFYFMWKAVDQDKVDALASFKTCMASCNVDCGSVLSNCHSWILDICRTCGGTISSIICAFNSFIILYNCFFIIFTKMLLRKAGFTWHTTLLWVHIAWTPHRASDDLWEETFEVSTNNWTLHSKLH